MKSRTAFIAIFALLAIAAVAIAIFALGGDKPPAHALRPNDASLLVRGGQIYTERCAACHGAELKGQPNWRTRTEDGLLPAPPHDAGGHTWHHPDDVLFRITKFGVARGAGIADYRSAMPAYDGVLSDEDIVAVLSWIKSRWPESVRRMHDDLNARSLKKTDR